MLSPAVRKTLLVAATVLALGIPASQALMGWGMDQREFSDQGDETLRAAGYAFSIWGLIYAGLVAHTVAQLFDRGRYEALLASLAPSIIAIAGCGAWIVASAFNARWASVAIILVSAASAYLALRRVRGRTPGTGEKLLAVWPIAMLGGWLLAASALNILMVMTAEGLIGADTTMAWAFGGIVAVTALTVLVIRTGVSAVYGLPVGWGLAGAFVAERADGQPAIAFAALAGAVLVGAAAAFTGFRVRG